MPTSPMLRACLGKADSCKREAQAAHRVADVKLEKNSRNADKAVELQKQQAASNMSVKELAADI